VLINPFNVDHFATAIREALALPVDERRRRMQAMRAALHRATIFDWLEAILARVDELARARDGGRPAVGAGDGAADAAGAAAPPAP
jgi:trehalose 6-phosphate synthase